MFTKYLRPNKEEHKNAYWPVVGDRVYMRQIPEKNAVFWVIMGGADAWECW